MKYFSQLIVFAKKYTTFIVISLVGFFFVPDIATFETTIFRLAVVSLITLLWLLLIGTVSGWGIFPDIDLKKLCDNSIDENKKYSSIASAIVLLSLILLLCTVIYSLLA